VWMSFSKNGLASQRWSSLLVKVRVNIARYVASGLCDLVGKMAKGEEWKDVRLLSFDLQTVEFAYAQVSGYFDVVSFY
jgi:hypothetical protein